MIPHREEDTNFGYFLNVDAPPFEVNESTGLSPCVTNDSGSFESPTYTELDNVKQDNTVTSPKTQFLAAIRDLMPSKEGNGESISRAARPILGKEFSVDRSNVIGSVNETTDGSGKKQFNSQSVNKDNQVDGSVEDNGAWGPGMKILEDRKGLCYSPTQEFTSIEALFRSNENQDTMSDNKGNSTPLSGTMSTDILQIVEQSQVVQSSVDDRMSDMTKTAVAMYFTDRTDQAATRCESPGRAILGSGYELPDSNQKAVKAEVNNTSKASTQQDSSGSINLREILNTKTWQNSAVEQTCKKRQESLSAKSLVRACAAEVTENRESSTFWAG